MKQILCALTLTALLAVFASMSQAATPELTLIIAQNATDLATPYSHGLYKFKEVAAQVSGSRLAVTVHKGTLGENESELIEKLTMFAADIVVSSPGFMTAIWIQDIDIFQLEYLFSNFEHWEKCLNGDLEMP